MKVRRPLYFASAALTAAVLIREYGGWPAALTVCAAIGVLLWHCRQTGQSHRGGNRSGYGLFNAKAGVSAVKVSEQRIVLALVFISFCAGLMSLALSDIRQAKDPVLQKLDRNVTFTASVKEVTARQNNRGQDECRLVCRVFALQGKRVRPARVLVTCPAKETTALPGSVICFDGIPRRPQTRRNPNTFDYRQFLRSRGILTTVRTTRVDVFRDGRETASGKIYRFQEKYIERIAAHEGEETAGLMRAVLFGNKDSLDEDIRQLFQKNGTAHVLAVSGLHVGMLYAALTALWNALSEWFPEAFGVRRGRRFFVCLALFFAGYMVMASFSASVVRAVFMVLLHAFAKLTNRRYDLSCAAFAVGAAALLINPYVLFSVGFQMSFLAVLTIGLITPYIKKVYSGVFLGSAAVQIGLGPYMVYQFNTVSIIAVLINVPVIFLTGILVPAGMAGMFLPLGGELWDRMIHILCAALIQMNDLVCVDGVTSIVTASPPVWTEALYYIGLFTFGCEEGRLAIMRGKRLFLTMLAAMVVAASCAFGAASDDGYRNMDIVFVDVGQGDCVHFRCGDRNYLIDGGGSAGYEVGTKLLKPYLLKNGVRRVDGAFVTHLHTDHYRGICEIARAGMVRRLFVFEANRLKTGEIQADTGLSDDQITFLRAEDLIRFTKNNIMEIIWPPAGTDETYREMLGDEEDENALSLIMRLQLQGISILATGDLGEDGEQTLLKTNADKLKSDVLKVGHHGSKYSTSDAFLEAVGPAVAVIQVGEHNMYGHPSPQTLRKLEERGIPVFRNDEQGAIGLKLRNGRVRSVKTMKQND